MRYLDHAATSWPKPPEVLQGWLDGMAIAGAAGRGGHTGSQQADDELQRTRTAFARHFQVRTDRVIFTSGGTASLNLALLGLLGPGDHVVSTTAEHNAVLRPLEHLRTTAGVSVSLIPVDAQGTVAPEKVLEACRPETRCVAISHASNVTGALLPIEQLATALRETRVLLLVDASQTTGHLSIEVDPLGIDLLATSGHKGLLGPLGTGLLMVSPRALEQLSPTVFGGTGVDSQSLEMPGSAPQRFESGVPNMPAWLAQRCALEWIEKRGLSALCDQHRQLTLRLWERLAEIPKVRRLGPRDLEDHCGPTSLVVEGWDPHDLAAVLDASFDIRVRAGLHCAPRIHEPLGAAGGTVRITPGWSNSLDDIEAVADALESIVAES